MPAVDVLSPEIATLAERKNSAVRRLKTAADGAVRDLRDYAGKHQGRFVVFGSYVKDALRFDSDLDVLVDFPDDRADAAWTFAEDIAARFAIPVDLHDARTSKAVFVEAVMSKGLCLS